jgi:hypothetical protein
MPNNLQVSIEAIKTKIRSIDRDSSFQFIKPQDTLLIRSKNVEARVNIELQLDSLQAALGITYNSEHTGAKLTFKIQL